LSWGPAKKAVKERAVRVEWKAEEEDEYGEKQDVNQMKMKSFLQAITKAKDGKKVQKRKRRRFDYLEKVLSPRLSKCYSTALADYCANNFYCMIKSIKP